MQDRPRHRRRQAGDRGRAAADRPRHRLPPRAARRPPGAADLDPHGPADEVRRDLRDAVLARRRAQRLRHQRPRRGPRGLRQHPAVRRPGRAARLRRRLDLAHLRRHAEGPAPGRGAAGVRRDVRPAGAAPGRLRRARLDQGAVDPRRPDRDPRPGHAGPLRPVRTPPARPRALGRHRDRDVLDRLHGRRRAARASAPPPRCSPSSDDAAAAGARTLRDGAADDRSGRARTGGRRTLGHDRVRGRARARASRRTSSCTATARSTPAAMPTRPAAGVPSKVFEWSRRRDPAAAPGRSRDRTSRPSTGSRSPTRRATGRLVVLETSTSTVLHAQPAQRDAGGPSPPCRARRPTTPPGDPGGALFVTDYAQGVIWKVSRRGQARAVVHGPPSLDGVAGFGTTGIVFRYGDVPACQRWPGSSTRG